MKKQSRLHRVRWDQLTIDERIHANGWFAGTEHDWQKLPREQRENMAFKATGCMVAFPTWQAPVNCVHACCVVKRGEKLSISLINGQLRYEKESGWLRFISSRTPQGRKQLASLFRGYRKLAREQHVYDIWKLGALGIVHAGIMA